MEDPVDASPAEKKPGRAEAAKILLVEDEMVIAQMIQIFLEDSPHHVTFVDNGKDAVTAFKKQKFDLVLMDLQLPVMDGHTATREIRNWESEQGLDPSTIIALSANVTIEEIDRCMEAGCTTHLPKPVHKSVLLETIDGYLSR
jgi:CheY-like chemotaxis protein